MSRKRDEMAKEYAGEPCYYSDDPSANYTQEEVNEAMNGYKKGWDDSRRFYYSPDMNKHNETIYDTDAPGKEGLVNLVHWWLNDQLTCDDEDGDFTIRESAEDLVDLIINELKKKELV